MKVASGESAVIVRSYDPTWKTDFEKISESIKDILGRLAIDIHHVGSTSVEGLAAKPIIDLDVVTDSNELKYVIEKLEVFGYKHLGDLGIPGREAFRAVEGEPKLWRRHNLYVCPSDSRELKRHLAFRDFLRNHPKLRDMYGRAKLNAVAGERIDIIEYMNRKGETVVNILEKAIIWAGIVPSPKKDKCPDCFSDKIETTFHLRYIGEGDKQGILQISCRNCDAAWKEIIK